MKKLLLTTLLAAMLLLPLGTIALADDEAPAANEESVEYIPGDAPAQSDVSSMTPALHAVLLAMDNQGVTSFTTGDGALSWEMLYNLLSMYGQLDDRSSYEGDELVLPSETVMDYSAALFASPLSPEELPDALADRMTYDSSSDEYRLYCGSDALSEVVIDSTTDLGSAVEVSGRLVYVAEGEELARFTATLALTDNMFGYTLAALDVA